MEKDHKVAGSWFCLFQGHQEAQKGVLLQASPSGRLVSEPSRSQGEGLDPGPR